MISERQKAVAEFKRIMIWIALIAVLMVAGALTYLHFTSSLDVSTVIATTLGVFISVLLGCGLFAGLLGQVGHGIANHGLEHAAHVISWALPFEALYQQGLALTTADQRGITGFLVELGPLGGGTPAGRLLLPFSVGYLVLVLVAATVATARRDL